MIKSLLIDILIQKYINEMLHIFNYMSFAL